MKNIKPWQLESSISYSERGVHGFPQIGITREEEPENCLCGYCQEHEIGADEEMCAECEREDELCK